MIRNNMKYYYDDPLAAAYMAKHFGMKFELIMYGVDTKETIHHAIGDEMFFWKNINLDTEKFGLRYCIHPDSLHLLGPQTGDLLEFRDDGHDLTCYRIREEGDWKISDGWFIKSITQRNGIPFMWPEAGD